MDSLPNKRYGYVPADWTDYPRDQVAYQRHGYATYCLKVIFSPLYSGQLALRVQTAGTSYRLYVDGHEMGSNGTPGVDRASTRSNYEPKLYFFERKSDTVSLVFHVATFDYRKGGLWQSVMIGKSEAVLRERDRLVFFDLFLFGSILIMVLYHLGLFALRKEDKLSLHFAILSIAVCLRLISTGEKLIIVWFENFNWQALIKMELGSVMLAPIAMTLYFNKLYPNMMHKWFIKGVVWIFSIFLAITLVFSAHINSYLVPVCNILWLFVLIYLLAFVVNMFIHKQPDSLAMALGTFISFCFVVNDLLFNAGVINTGYTLPWAVFVFFFSQSFLLSARFSRAFTQISNLSNLLQEANEDLESKIASRTAQLQTTTDQTVALNKQMQSTLEIVNSQKNIIESKNRSITSAISYASKIQRGLLPGQKNLKDVLGDYFLIFEPKDIVSGDFYWCRKFDGFSYFALADCTGHGVPGAFMSLISMVLLHQVSKSDKEPGQIIQQLHKLLRNVLPQEDRIGQDGLDLALIKITEKEIFFAGSGRDIAYFHNHQQFVIRGDRSFINFDPNKINEPPKTHRIELAEGMNFYLYTDGLTDQFGGKDYAKFGRKRFFELLASIQDLPIQAQGQNILETLSDWKASGQQTDDISLVAFSINRP